MLKTIDGASYAATRQLLKECQDFVESLLVDRTKDQKALEKKIVRSIQREASEEKESRPPLEEPENVSALLEGYDFPGLQDWRELVRYLDESVLQVRLTPEEYQEMLTSLGEFLDERI